MNILKTCVGIVSCAFVLGACGSTDSGPRQTPNWLTPYRVDLPQGNLLTKEQVDALKPGMRKDEARFILGSPPIASMFHENRWDYPFQWRHKSGKREERKLTIYFKGDLVDKIVADEMPTQKSANQ